MIEVLERDEHKAYLGDDEIDYNLASQVAGRVWVLVLNDKQLGITLTTHELLRVMTELERGGSGLWKR